MIFLSYSATHTKRNATVVAFILLVIGTALLVYALTLAPYRNEALFEQRYLSLSAGQSEEYWKLRDEMLTPKFQLEDYGVTLIVMALATFIIGRKGVLRLQAPNSRRAMVVLAIALPFLTVGGYVFDLFHAFDRGEFPHWADSLSIPLMGAPIQLIVLLGWSLAHLGFLRGVYQPATPLFPVSRKSNGWLLFISGITAIILLFNAAAGAYWYAIPGAFGLYFYLSLSAGRSQKNGE